MKNVLYNPVYMGKIAYGRRRTEKKQGTRNEMHVVEQSEFPVYEGQHEAMQDWEKRLNSFIEMFDYGILQDAGKVSAEIAKLHAETEFEKYRVIQDRLFMSDFDRYMLELEESAKK